MDQNNVTKNESKKGKPIHVEFLLKEKYKIMRRKQIINKEEETEGQGKSQKDYSIIYR